MRPPRNLQVYNLLWYWLIVFKSVKKAKFKFEENNFSKNWRA